MDGRMRKALWGLWLLAALLPAQAQEVYYIHTDALGSPVAETDASRNVVARFEYEPYGRRLNASNDDKPGYTGHVMDAVTGLVQMQQRYYDPGIGRFLSVDPVVAINHPVALFNRYSYAGNNPINAVDPDGQRCVSYNAYSIYCMRRDIYRNFDRQVAGSTRFFGAAAATVEYLANGDMWGLGRMGGSSQARAFLHHVSRELYAMNAQLFLQIRSGSLSGANLDSELVHREQTRVQELLDGLPEGERSSIVSSLNAAFGRRWIGDSHAADRRYNRVLDRVERSLGRAIDFGKQSDREAIGNAVIQELRRSGACSATGTRIRQC